MKTSRRIVPYILAAAITAATSSCVTRNPESPRGEFASFEEKSTSQNHYVKNFFGTLFRIPLSIIATPYVGIENLVEGMKKDGLSSSVKNSGEILGALIPNVIDELPYLISGEKTRPLLGEKGNTYKAIEKNPIIKTLFDTVPSTIIGGPRKGIELLLKVFPVSYTLKQVVNLKDKSTQTQVYKEKQFER